MDSGEVRINALEPWPDTVDWRPVSHDLIWVELVRLAIWLVIMLGAMVTGWCWPATGSSAPGWAWCSSSVCGGRS